MRTSIQAILNTSQRVARVTYFCFKCFAKIIAGMSIL